MKKSWDGLLGFWPLATNDNAVTLRPILGLCGSSWSRLENAPSRTEAARLRCLTIIRMDRFCYGYIAVAAHGMYLARGEFCYPREGLTNSIFTRVTMTYLYQHPEQLHKSAVVLVNAAFAQAYPCPGSK
jgi:Rap1a immunity proteins